MQEYPKILIGEYKGSVGRLVVDTNAFGSGIISATFFAADRSIQKIVPEYESIMELAEVLAMIECEGFVSKDK